MSWPLCLRALPPSASPPVCLSVCLFFSLATFCKNASPARLRCRTVTVEEAEQYCVSQDECCIFVEASAKRNYHVDDLFYQLFVVAGLPLEMAPNHHRKVPLTFGSPTMLPPSQVRKRRDRDIRFAEGKRIVLHWRILAVGDPTTTKRATMNDRGDPRGKSD